MMMYKKLCWWNCCLCGN